MPSETTLQTATLWKREDCADYLGIAISTFYARYKHMVEHEGAPRPCTGRGRGARWLPQDWKNWAARRNQPVAVEQSDHPAWSRDFAALMKGSNPHA